MLIPEDQEDTKLEDEESERSIDEEKSTVESKEPLNSGKYLQFLDKNVIHLFCY
jgi:hypothetical protein